MDHSFQDRASLEMARRVARGLAAHPEWLQLAKENLSRWKTRHEGSPSLLRCYDEWECILKQPVDVISATLTRADEEGQRLRQSAPFPGCLSAREVWSIKAALRHEAR